MRILGVICVGLTLGGCANAEKDGSAAGNIAASMTDVVMPGARTEYQAQVDDKKCREFGHEPKSEGYADCRMELQRIRGRH